MGHDLQRWLRRPAFWLALCAASSLLALCLSAGFGSPAVWAAPESDSGSSWGTEEEAAAPKPPANEAEAGTPDSADTAEAAAGTSTDETAQWSDEPLAVQDAGTGENVSISNPPPPAVEPGPEALAALRYKSTLPASTDKDTRKLLSDILARPEFQEDPQQKPRQESWLQRLLRALQQWFSKLGFGMVAGSNVATVIAAVLLGTLLLLLIYLLVRWIWDALSVGSNPRTSMDEKAEEEMEPDALARLAMQALARGEIRQAIRLRFKAVLRRLPQTSATVLLTNSQLKRRLAREYPSAAAPFGRLVVCFEDAWYGGMSVSEADYRSADGWAREVEQLVPLESQDKDGGQS